jgi:hypothetical protein
MIRNLFLISIGLLVVAIPALHECQDLMDCEILSPVPCFEAAHPQDMASGQTYKFAGLASSIFMLMPFVAPDSSEEVFLPSFEFPLSSNQPLVLRC